MKLKHPMQPLVRDHRNVIRFKENAIIAWLHDVGRLDLNQIAIMNFNDEDREQLAQLIGYSVSGFGDLSYARKKTVRKADRRASKM